MLAVEEQIGLIADAAMDALDLDTAVERRATPRKTVLDQMPGTDTWSPVQFTEEVVTMIDVKTSGPVEPPQKRPMRVVVAGILAAAAAVVAIVVVARSDVDVVTPADDPSPTVTVTPPTPPRALPNPCSGVEDACGIGERFEPGTYYVDKVEGTPTPRIFVTIGAGWSDNSSVEESLAKEGIGFITFSRPYAVFSDACHWSDGFYPGPVATLDGLVTALTEQGGWAMVTAPSDISVDGYAGKAFQRTAPAEFSDCNTQQGRTRSSDDLGPHPRFKGWESDAGGALYEPGQTETLWVLDLDGTVVVINTNVFSGSSTAARDEFADVLDSIRIDRA
jgi:hypothetical protein